MANDIDGSTAPSVARNSRIPARFPPDGADERRAAGTSRELIEGVIGRRLGARAAAQLDHDPHWLSRHARATPAEWAAQLEIPGSAARRLACALELSRRAACPPRRADAVLRTPRDAFEWLASIFEGLDRETVVALYLDGRHRLIQRHEVSVGTATASLLHPREVFGPALRLRACAVVVAHNHPSGDPEPSAEDRGVTERLQAAGELVGVPLLDHLVVAGGEFVSLRGRCAWSERPRRA